MIEQKGIVVIGSHTDIGKTVVACTLVRALRAAGIPVVPRKPVLSGVSDDGDALRHTDTARLLDAAGLPFSRFAEVTPLVFRAPRAPDAAARAEGRSLLLDDVVQACHLPADPSTFVVLETAGGIMSPVAEDGLVVDLCVKIGLPVLLVVGTYLGGISHGLSAHVVAKNAGLDVRGVIVSRASGDGDVEPFRRFLPGVPILGLPSLTDGEAPPSAWLEHVLRLCR
ncbi:MAG: dethiobiotin synthase [Myxococcota bacterium]